jgi:hypothetical protein
MSGYICVNGCLNAKYDYADTTQDFRGFYHSLQRVIGPKRT